MIDNFFEHKFKVGDKRVSTFLVKKLLINDLFIFNLEINKFFENSASCLIKNKFNNLTCVGNLGR